MSKPNTITPLADAKGNESQKDDLKIAFEILSNYQKTAKQVDSKYQQLLENLKKSSK
jgi:membrane-anchored protein YejM (alkaline phosphatase superfamily)